MADTTRIDELLDRDVCGHLRRLYDCLIEIGLKTKMPTNSKTLLFEGSGQNRKKHGLAAMRSGNASVLSFPKTYWGPRKDELMKAVEHISSRHFIDVQGAVSESQYSAMQIRVSDDTVADLLGIIRNLIAQHNSALTQ